MRDTAIALLAFLAVVGAYRYFGGKPTMESSALTTAQSSQPAPTAKRIAKGDTHGSRSSHARHQENSADEESTGAAGEAPQAEALTSIYEDENPARRERRSGITAPEVAKAPRKVIYGVPVQAYVHSRRNHLAGPVADNSAAGPMRVYLQCMEVKKKGLQYIGEHTCEELISGSTPSKLEHPGQRRPWFPSSIGG